MFCGVTGQHFSNMIEGKTTHPSVGGKREDGEGHEILGAFNVSHSNTEKTDS